MESDRQKKLDMPLDMNKVIAQLTGFSPTLWLDDNHFQNSTLSMKYSILQKSEIANWFPRLHISYVSKDLDILMFLVSNGEPFDMGKVAYQVIVSNAESEHAYGVLPFPH